MVNNSSLLSSIIRLLLLLVSFVKCLLLKLVSKQERYLRKSLIGKMISLSRLKHKVFYNHEFGVFVDKTNAPQILRAVDAGFTAPQKAQNVGRLIGKRILSLPIERPVVHLLMFSISMRLILSRTLSIVEQYTLRLMILLLHRHGLLVYLRMLLQESFQRFIL